MQDKSSLIDLFSGIRVQVSTPSYHLKVCSATDTNVATDPHELVMKFQKNRIQLTVQYCYYNYTEVSQFINTALQHL